MLICCLQVMTSGGSFDVTDLQHVQLGVLFVGNKRLTDIRFWGSHLSHVSVDDTFVTCFLADTSNSCTPSDLGVFSRRP